MKVVLVAPFVMSCRVDLAAFAAGDPHGVCAELSQATFDGWQLRTYAAPKGSAVIDDHEPVGITLVPRRVLSAARPSTTPGVDRVEVTVGAHGVAALVLWCDAPATAIGEIESSARTQIPALAADLTAFLTRPSVLLQKTQGDNGRYPVDTVLWWHRVVYRGHLRRDSRDLVGGVSRDLGVGRSVIVADGYTAVSRVTDDSDVAAIVEGVIDAQEYWIVSETSARAVITQITTLQTSTDPNGADLSEVARKASDAADSELLRAAILQDQVRYTRGVRRQTFDAAVDAWGLSHDVERANHGVVALQRMLTRRAGDRVADEQRTLSAFLFVLTVVTSFGLLLTFFDTATGPAAEHHALRIVVATTTLVLAAISGVLVWKRTRDR